MQTWIQLWTQSEIYSGVYGRVSISFYAFNSNGNKGIACGLNNLQKIKDGEPLGGHTSAEADFASLADDDFLVIRIVNVGAMVGSYCRLVLVRRNKTWKRLSIDLETYSSININKCGVYKYCESEDFEILLRLLNWWWFSSYSWFSTRWRIACRSNWCTNWSRNSGSGPLMRRLNG